MTFERPGVHPLPGSPDAFFLPAGEGERAMLGDSLFTVLLSGDETDGQFGVFTCEAPPGGPAPTHFHVDVHETFHVLEGKVRVFLQQRDGTRTSRLLGPGDFGYVPAGLAHTYEVVETARLVGVSTGGFERFFQHAGTATDRPGLVQPPSAFDVERFAAASRLHRTTMLPDFEWPEPREEN